MLDLETAMDRCVKKIKKKLFYVWGTKGNFM
jgi:hypothetical protein